MCVGECWYLKTSRRFVALRSIWGAQTHTYTNMIVCLIVGALLTERQLFGKGGEREARRECDYIRATQMLSRWMCFEWEKLAHVKGNARKTDHVASRLGG